MLRGCSNAEMTEKLYLGLPNVRTYVRKVLKVGGKEPQGTAPISHSRNDRDINSLDERALREDRWVIFVGTLRLRHLFLVFGTAMRSPRFPEALRKSRAKPSFREVSVRHCFSAC